jgi:hypothetical protein
MAEQVAALDGYLLQDGVGGNPAEAILPPVLEDTAASRDYEPECPEKPRKRASCPMKYEAIVISEVR